MTAQVIPMASSATCMEHLAPSLAAPVGGPIRDARMEIGQLMTDMQTAVDFCTAQHIPVLTIAADRNGAYLVVAPAAHLRVLFGDECTCWRRGVSGHLVTEHWIGLIGHIRVFWREVNTCN